jgi:peptidoglycan hydrolase CwlO-like protein
MTTSIILQIILIAIVLFMFFWQSYFSKKGENLATKEDIEDITKKVETIKNEIHSTVSRKNDFLNERKKVALSFFDNTCFFIDYSSKVIDILGNNSDNIALIQKQTEEVRSQGAKIVSSFLKLFIYFEENSLTASARNYYDSVVEIQQSVIGLLCNLEQNSLMCNLMLESFKLGQIQHKDELLQKVQEKKTLIENHVKNRQTLLDDTYKKRKSYIDELSKIIKD